MQYESANPLSGVTLEFFSRKYRQSQWRTRWKISPRHHVYGKVLPRQVDLKYVGRLLLDTEEGCTWHQIPAKVIRLYILEESFCLFHEYVKYYFAHLNSSISLKPCLIESFCIHIWIQHKKYYEVHLLKFVGQKKFKFCWPVLSEYKGTPITSAIFRKNYLCHSRNKGEASEALARKAGGGEMTYL